MPLRRGPTDQDGRDVVEYGLLLATVLLVVLLALSVLGMPVDEWVQTIIPRLAGGA